MAFPPAWSTSTPTRVAYSSVETTMPLSAVTAISRAEYRHWIGKSANVLGSGAEHAVNRSSSKVGCIDPPDGYLFWWLRMNELFLGTFSLPRYDAAA